MKHIKSACRASLVIAAMALMLMLAACGGSKTIDLTEFITINITGDDVYGEASYAFDYSALESAVAQALKLDATSLDFAQKMLTIEEGIHTHIDRFSNLCNGDMVTVYVTYDGPDAKQTGVTLKTGEVTNKVSGLVPIEPFSFDEITLLESLAQHNLFFYMQEIPFQPEQVFDVTLGETTTDLATRRATVDFSLVYDAKIALLDVNGSGIYEYDNGQWVMQSPSYSSSIRDFTLAGTYEGTEYDIAAKDVSCHAVYEISDNGDGTYTANVTWSGNEHSPDMQPINSTLQLECLIDTMRFFATNDNAHTIQIGHEPYLYRAFKFDFAAGALITEGEVALYKK